MIVWDLFSFCKQMGRVYDDLLFLCLVLSDTFLWWLTDIGSMLTLHFPQQIFTDFLLSAEHCFRCWGKVTCPQKKPLVFGLLLLDSGRLEHLCDFSREEFVVCRGMVWNPEIRLPRSGACSRWVMMMQVVHYEVWGRSSSGVDCDGTMSISTLGIKLW